MPPPPPKKRNKHFKIFFLNFSNIKLLIEKVLHCITFLKVKHLLCLPGIDEISEDVYKGVEHSDSEESDKSDSSDSEYGSDDEPKSGQDDKNTVDDKNEKEPPKKKSKPSVATAEDKVNSTESAATAITATKGETSQKTSTSEPIAKDKPDMDSEKEPPEKLKAAPASPDSRKKPKGSEEAVQPASVDVDMDSDSERELVIDLGEEQAGKERKRNRKDSAAVTALKEHTASKPEGQISLMNQVWVKLLATSASCY